MASTQSSEPRYKVVVERNLAMRTRDGVTLHADVYRPDTHEKLPVLVVRTPYDRSMELALTEKDYFPSRGYVVVVQDTRGRFGSEGDFVPFAPEGHDGYDTIEWAASLPWSNSAVGMVGQSYLALVQYLAAVERPPHLKALSPVSGPVSFFENCIWRHGVFELAWMLTYFNFMARNTLDRKGLLEAQRTTYDSWLSHPEIPLSSVSREACAHIPILDWAERMRDGAPYFADYLKNSTYSPYWQSMDVRRRLENLDTPMLHVGSWYDAFQYDTLALFSGARERAATPDARQAQKLVMGPWGHLMPYAVPTSKGAGDIDFGAQAKIELHAIQLRWFDRYLKGVRNGIDEEAPVRLFVMGENRWRDENEWPLKRTRYTRMHLHSGGRANTLGGDGALRFDAPSDSPPDRYTYDPRDPVPTRGGNALGIPMGVFDQREVERRDDVLVYTSDVLTTDTEITGPILLRLFAASSATDTDFTAKLIDVRPDGYAHNLAEGVVRARFRESLAAPAPIKPDQVYEYTIDMWATSHLLKAGHRIRLEVSSSNFPRWDRNPNTGHDFGVDGELAVAQQAVFHDSRYASHLVLPIIPR
jgi:putative CocE/NonD family hydrolase